MVALVPNVPPNFPWVKEDPHSLYSKCPFNFQIAMVEAFAKSPEFFQLDERDLYEKMKSMKMMPTPSDNQVRLQLWFAYYQSIENGTPIRGSAIYAGVMDESYFWRQFLARPEKVAWITTPPASYITRLKEGSEYGLMLMRNILSEDPKDYEPKDRLKVFELQAKIFQMLDTRLRGTAVQRNLTVNITDQEASKEILSESMESVEKRIKELEARDRRRERQLAQEQEIMVKTIPTDIRDKAIEVESGE